MASGIAAHLKERIDRFSQIRTYLAGRPFPSPRKRMEKHIAEMKLILLQKSLTEVSSEKDILWARLNLFTDLPSPVTIQAPWFAKGHALDREAVLAKAARDNPALKKQLLLLEKTNAETRLARVFARPDFSLSLQYREERAPDTERFIGAGVSVPLPIWNANRDGVRSMEAAGEAGKARLEHTSRETRQALDALLIEYGIARRNIELLPLSTLESVHSRLSDADDSFRKGLKTFSPTAKSKRRRMRCTLPCSARRWTISIHTRRCSSCREQRLQASRTAGKAR
jgi:hypothetical protein